MTQPQTVARMQNLIVQWENESDDRSVFLDCYRMMTENMIAAIEGCDFRDPVWVEKLLERFAEYYFTALQAYDEDPLSAPQVWQIAHDYAHDGDAWALQKLLLGVNAHINYDLVLTLDEMLEAEWGDLSPDRREERHWDYSYVNDIITRTIDAVQDQVLEPAMPWMDLLDKMLGNEDERLISSLLTRWREKVWDYAMQLLDSRATGERSRVIQQVEDQAIKLSRVIMRTDLTTWFDE